jgi:DnaJ family protein C protein 28
MSDESPATGQQEGRKSRTRRQWTDLVEQLLEEARDRGDFDNLEGKGKPLALDQNPYAGDRALAYSLLKNNDFAMPGAPSPWLALRRWLAMRRCSRRSIARF